MTAAQALLEAERCLYCFDAPCASACPTHIDVPSFIRRIADANLRGAARTILDSNPLGGMCARVCPTEVLCEQVCVRNTQEGKPVAIGRLQRHAVDAVLQEPATSLFTRAPSSGKHIAVLGAGPAGLACAHTLARLGHRVVMFDARPKAGGLNEYGLATYKTPEGFAQRELVWLLSIGGIEVRNNWKLGSAAQLAALRQEFDAVFLGLNAPVGRSGRALQRRAGRGRLHRHTAPEQRPLNAASGTTCCRHWRRHDSGRCRSAGQTAGSTKSRHGVPARSFGDAGLTS
jgi:glutamate synthase (NADPH/NADH) small chain